ncbi:MAG: aldo/keto reductase [Bacillota bacterium]
MEYGYFGGTGLKLSRIVFGTQTFGWSVEEKDAFRILDYYIDQGGNYLDVADSYNKGASEIITGNWLKESKKRHEIVLGTKVFFPTGDGPNDSGLSRTHIMNSIEKSLERFHTDYIDVYQIHCYDQMTAMEEVILTMDYLVQQGKIRNYGVSNYTPSKIMKGLMYAKNLGKAAISSVQLEYSLLVRSPEWELLPLCNEENLGVFAWSALGGGWLTGKYRRNKEIPLDSRAGVGDRWDDNEEQRGGERTYKIIDRLVEISTRIEKPVPQVALNWMLNKTSPFIFPLIGARTIEQLKCNLDAINWKLSKEDEKLLDEASDIGIPSPYNFINRYTRY